MSRRIVIDRSVMVDGRGYTRTRSVRAGDVWKVVSHGTEQGARVTLEIAVGQRSESVDIVTSCDLAGQVNTAEVAERCARDIDFWLADDTSPAILDIDAEWVEECAVQVRQDRERES